MFYTWQKRRRRRAWPAARYSSFSTDRGDNSPPARSSRQEDVCAASGFPYTLKLRCILQRRWLAAWSIFCMRRETSDEYRGVSFCLRTKEGTFYGYKLTCSRRELCGQKTSGGGNDNFTWKGSHANENMYEGKNCFWCGLHSLSPLEGRVMKCTRSKDRIRIAPFLWASLGNLLTRRCSSSSSLVSSYAARTESNRVWCFWNVFAIVLMKNGRNCATRFHQPRVSCKKHTNSVQFLAVNLGEAGGFSERKGENKWKLRIM